jgi:uncharacterized protein (TIGR02246 family)
VIDDLMVQFNPKNADGFVSFVATNGWFVDVVAHVLSGRDEILPAHLDAFAGPTKDAVCTLHDVRSRPLSPGVAYVEAPWTITHQGAAGSTGAPRPPRRGLLDITLVQNRDDENWVMTSGTNTDYTHAFTTSDTTFTDQSRAGS